MNVRLICQQQRKTDFPTDTNWRHSFEWLHFYDDSIAWRLMATQRWVWIRFITLAHILLLLLLTASTHAKKTVLFWANFSLLLMRSWICAAISSGPCCQSIVFRLLSSHFCPLLKSVCASSNHRAGISFRQLGPGQLFPTNIHFQTLSKWNAQKTHSAQTKRIIYTTTQKANKKYAKNFH